MRVILAQTDTTVGFLSQDEKRLQEIKSREHTKTFIKVYRDFKTLLKYSNRVPKQHKNSVRRAKKTTFIIKNRAFRVVKNSSNSQLIRDLDWHYSTSANRSRELFHREFCEEKADIIVEDRDGLRELSSSSLYKLNNYRKRKIR